MDEELRQYLSKMDKKLDKILNLHTKIAKALHLLPVSEKEERAIQIAQRTNLNQAAKIAHELDALENKNLETDNSLNITGLFDNDNDIYGDIIADDFLGGE